MARPLASPAVLFPGDAAAPAAPSPQPRSPRTPQRAVIAKGRTGGVDNSVLPPAKRRRNVKLPEAPRERGCGMRTGPNVPWDSGHPVPASPSSPRQRARIRRKRAPGPPLRFSRCRPAPARSFIFLQLHKVYCAAMKTHYFARACRMVTIRRALSRGRSAGREGCNEWPRASAGSGSLLPRPRPQGRTRSPEPPHGTRAEAQRQHPRLRRADPFHAFPSGSSAVIHGGKRPG